MIKFCSLYSGSSGNSVFIGSQNTKLLVDAGVSCKRIVESLNELDENPEDLSGIVITHEHVDHIKAIGVLNKKFKTPIYANEKTWNEIGKKFDINKIMNKEVFTTGKDFYIGDICINPFKIPHDAVDPVGFNIIHNDKKISIATDIGHINESIINKLSESEIILLESNHDENMVMMSKYPWFLKKRILGNEGHLSNENAGKLIVNLFKNGTNKFLLGHLSRENNFPELAMKTVENLLYENNIEIGKDIFLEIAKRDQLGGLFCFN